MESKNYCFLDIHLRKNSNERPFICEFPNCQKSYTTASHLKRHISLVHEKEDAVICDIPGCGIVLSSKYTLKKHKIRSHIESPTPFACSVCPERFQKRWQLNQHSFVHSGKPAFICSICDLGFDQLHLYNKHKRNHKTYTCDCGETFGKWTIFCEHRRNSCTIKKIDHKCIICNRVFTTKANLTQHTVKVHLEESQDNFYRCTHAGCTRGYKYKKNLTAHISTNHEKVEESLPVKCTEPGCEKMVKNQRNLRRHLARVHQEAKKVNTKKERWPRKDTGKPKKCMASILSGVQLPSKEHLDIINERAKSDASLSNQTRLENSVGNNSRDISEATKEDEISQSIPTGLDKSDGSSLDVASASLDSEDILLQHCNEMMIKIQECLEHSPVQAKQDSMAYCEVQA